MNDDTKHIDNPDPEIRVVSPSFENAEALAAMHPKSFFIPLREDREALFPGDYVKLIFRSEVPLQRGPWAGATGERMWVRVRDVEAHHQGGPRYVGTLANRPAYIDLEFGALIHFAPEHIIDIRKAG
jgi:hypothetical protein